MTIDATKLTAGDDLTARGVTKPVTLEVAFERPPAEAVPDDIIALTGAPRINRCDFGMKSYRLIVRNYVNIELRARMVPLP